MPTASAGAKRLCFSCVSARMVLLGEAQRWGVGMTDVTRILNAIERGDARATEELLLLAYEELRLLAG